MTRWLSWDRRICKIECLSCIIKSSQVKADFNMHTCFYKKSWWYSVSSVRGTESMGAAGNSFPSFSENVRKA